MTVERHELRNRNTTSTVSSAPSTSVVCTLAHRPAHALARRPATTASFAAAGQPLLERARARAFTSSATAVVE